MASGFSSLILPDGGKLAYEIYGSLHLGRSVPIVLICGMSALRADWERLSYVLARTRPVLLYDHRGMGDSTYASPTEDDEITVESLARDLFHLLKHLGWKEVSLCGYSMGGVVAQQLLLLPFHPTKPTALPFRVTHLLLAGTRSSVVQSGLRYSAPPQNRPRTVAERKENARRILQLAFDPSWAEKNQQRLDTLLARVISGSRRTPATIVKQGIALQKFNFGDLLGKLSPDVQVMVIHGQLDQIIPFGCAQEILKQIPWARFIEQGDGRGQVPSLSFGHQWFEYFDPQVWLDVVDVFLAQKHSAAAASQCMSMPSCD